MCDVFVCVSLCLWVCGFLIVYWLFFFAETAGQLFLSGERNMCVRVCVCVRACVRACVVMSSWKIHIGTAILKRPMPLSQHFSVKQKFLKLRCKNP